VPDFKLTHLKTGKEVFVEVFGFWRKGDIEAHYKNLSKGVPGSSSCACPSRCAPTRIRSGVRQRRVPVQAHPAGGRGGALGGAGRGDVAVFPARGSPYVDRAGRGVRLGGPEQEEQPDAPGDDVRGGGALVAAPFAAGEDKKLERPKLDAKEWKKLDNGLEVWDVKEGKGEAVKPGATVTIHYTGWLTDEKATKFDSSVDRGEKATFPLNRLIKGWQEGIPGMKPGGVRRLKIPAELAYGRRAGRASRAARRWCSRSSCSRRSECRRRGSGAVSASSLDPQVRYEGEVAGVRA
jgi:hypothetical protein